MADFSALKATIQSYIKQNGNEAITGNILQDILLAMVQTMGDGAINGLTTALNNEATTRSNADGVLQTNINNEATTRSNADTALGGRIDGVANAVNTINEKLAEGYIYTGIATPSTNPDAPTGKVFYIATEAGTYTNFGSLSVTQGINILKYNGSAWSRELVVGIDDAPVAGSANLANSGGIADRLYVVPRNDGYILEDGTIEPDNAWKCSDMFPVIEGDVITVFSRTGNSGETFVLGFYDANQDFLKNVSPISTEAGWTTKTVTVPQGAYFAIINTTYNPTYDSGYYPFAYVTKSTQELAKRAYDAASVNAKTISGDSSYFVNNGYIQTDGSIDVPPTSSWKNTDLIAIPIKSSYKIRNVYGVPETVGNIVFYDCDEKIISIIVAEVDGLTTLSGTVPDEAVFVRLCTKTTDLSSVSFIFSYSNPFETVMDAFGKAKSVYGRGDLFTNIGYIDIDNVVDSADPWRYTDYFIVPTGAKYVVKNINGVPDVVGSIVFYNIEKNVVENGVVQTDVIGLTTLKGTVPENAFYARLTTKLVDVDKISFEFRWDNPFETILTAINTPLGVPLLYGNNFMGKPFSFNGKTAAFFGDSVTKGVKSNPLSQATTPYVDWLSTRLGLTKSNYAISGTCICDPTNDPESILNQVITHITSQTDFDYIFIAGGINDFATGKPLGTISDDDYTTFFGSLKVICDHLNTVLAGKDTQVFFMTPLNFSRSEEHWASVVAPLNAYRNAIFKVAAMNGYNVVDLSVLPFPMGIQAGADAVAYQQAVIYDGIHPTEYGHKMMGLNIAAILL